MYSAKDAQKKFIEECHWHVNRIYIVDDVYASSLQDIHTHTHTPPFSLSKSLNFKEIEKLFYSLSFFFFFALLFIQISAFFLIFLFVIQNQSIEDRAEEKKNIMKLIVKVCLIFLLNSPVGWAKLTEYVKWQSINYKNLPREFYALLFFLFGVMNEKV